MSGGAPALTLALGADDKAFSMLVRGVMGRIVQQHPDATLPALRGLLGGVGKPGTGKCSAADGTALARHHVLAMCRG